MRGATVLLGCALIAGLAPRADAAPRKAPPPAPAIAPGTRTFVAFAGRPAPVRVAWLALPNVARYRARWVQAGALIDIELSGTATAFEREVSSAGHHQLTLVAIDDTGRESPPIEVGIDIVAVAAIAPGAAEPTTPRAPAFAVGARFRSPGLPCRLGDGPAAPEVAAREPGPTTLHCGSDAGPRVAVPIVIAPVIVDGPKQPLVRGAATQLHLTVASVAELGEHLAVEADGGVEVGAIRRTAHGLDVTVTPKGGAATATLTVKSRADAPGAVTLGRVALAIVDPPPPPPPPPIRTVWFALDLGYHVGVIVPTGERPAIGAGAREVAARPLGGARVGLFPTRRVGVEAELALAAPDYGSGQRTWLVSARAQLAARVVDARFGLRLVAGAGALSTAGAVHYGGSLGFETRDNLSLQLQALHAITTARDGGYAHCLELQLGLVARLGRRDR